MIVLYSKFYVKKELNTKLFINRAISWVFGMRNIPQAFRGLKYEHEEMQEIQEGVNSVEYAVDTELGLSAFCLKLEDKESGELWRTDIVLKEDEPQGLMQIRLAREQKKATAIINDSFHIPWVLRQFIKDQYGGVDCDLRVGESPHYLGMEDVDQATHCILESSEYLMPIVYVSKLFYEEDYSVDVEKLASDLVGIAHVLVENESSVATYLKETTGERNPYNGAIGIYYENGDYSIITRKSWMNKNQFRNEITHSIYRRISMLNIPDNQSISYIQSKILLRNVSNNIELSEKDRRIRELEIQLSQKCSEVDEAKQELRDYIDTFGENEKALCDAQFKLQYYQSVIEQRNEGGVVFKNTEKEFYPGEIKDVILELLEEKQRGYGDNQRKRRSYHIIKDFLGNNSISEYREEFKQRVRVLFEKGINERTLSEFSQAGFEIKGNDHQKAYFHNDGRYMVTIASTPSERRGIANTAHDAIDILFK